MKHQLQQRRYSHYINIRKKKQQEIIQARRFLMMSEEHVQPVQPIQPIQPSINYQLLFDAVRQYNTAYILEGLAHVAGSLNHFDENICRKIITNGIPQVLLQICDPNYIRLLNSQHQVFIKTRCIYILSRLSYLREFKQQPQLLNIAAIILDNLEKSNPLRLKYLLIFFANTIECEEIFDLALNHRLIHQILDLLDLHDKWALQMQAIMIWFFRNALQAVDKYRRGTTEEQCRRILKICLSIVNRMSKYQQETERQDTLLDSLVIITHIQHFCQDQLVTFEFSKTAFIQICRSKQLTKKHAQQSLIILEHICRTSEEQSLQLCSNIYFLPTIIENLQYSPDICLRIFCNLAAIQQCHRFLKDVSIIIGIQLEDHNPHLLHYEYVFNYFEANNYSLQEESSKQLLWRMMGCHHHSPDLSSQLEFWSNLMVINGPIEVPEYLFNIVVESDRLNFILEKGLRK